MPWTGRKKLALIPLFRSNAHPPDQIPPNWSDDILRRMLFDLDPEGTDRSLRAYINAASSGRADLDPVVMPMQVIDQQDVLPDALEGQLGSQLRDQGFDAAAIVMLGGPGAGSTRGFWCRFVMLEGVGVWAMEFMHSLTGFGDLYTLPGYSDNPNGDMGAFDEMACSCGTHPSAYTKAAIGWIDASIIAQHIGRTVNYDLHSVGLVQPPPSGRWAAVRVGSQVPYLMVEARQMIDQFDRNIPSQGVIIYRVQTSDPLGHAQQNLIPVFLLTTTALAPGASFTADNGINVQVTKALSGGFSVRIEDPNQHVVDRSGQYGTPAAAAPPTVCVVPGLGVHDIAYRDTSGHLHELWRDAQGGTGTTDLTKIAVGGAPTAIGNPFFYVDTTRNILILLYREGNGTVHSLYWSTGAVGHDNLSGTAGAPNAAGDPVGYYVPAADTHHVIYRTGDGNLHELNWVGVAPVNYGGNLTGAISAPHAAGDPTAFANAAGYNFVVYRSSANGEILSLYWSQGPSGLDQLSDVAGTPPAAGDPFGYYTAYNDTHQIVYRAGDGHVYELYWTGNDTVTGWDIMPSDAPPATGNLAAYYSAGTNTKHVFYRSADGQLHEIWWVPGGGTPGHVNLNERFGAPLAADRPAAFTVEGPNTQHVAYRGTDNHIYEVIW
jgi:hypothetical protein